MGVETSIHKFLDFVFKNHKKITNTGDRYVFIADNSISDYEALLYFHHNETYLPNVRLYESLVSYFPDFDYQELQKIVDEWANKYNDRFINRAERMYKRGRKNI